MDRMMFGHCAGIPAVFLGVRIVLIARDHGKPV